MLFDKDFDFVPDMDLDGDRDLADALIFGALFDDEDSPSEGDPSDE